MESTSETDEVLDEGRGPRRSTLLIALFLLVLLAVVLTYVFLGASWGITEMYGSEGIPWLGLAAWAVLPALAVAGALRVALALRARSKPGVLVLFVVSWLSLTLVAGALVALADRTHDQNMGAIETACSDADGELLMGLPIATNSDGSARGEVRGAKDGTCTLDIEVEGDAATATATVTASLVADGWTQNGSDGQWTTFAKGDALLLVRAGESDGKGTTPVVLAVPAQG